MSVCGPCETPYAPLPLGYEILVSMRRSHTRRSYVPSAIGHRIKGVYGCQYILVLISPQLVSSQTHMSIGPFVYGRLQKTACGMSLLYGYSADACQRVCQV